MGNLVKVLTQCWLTEKWGQLPTQYNGTKSIQKVVFHTTNLNTNTNTPGDKIETWKVLDVTSKEDWWDSSEPS